MSVDADISGRRAAWRRFGPWAAALLAVVCFANSFRNGFVYDDRAIVEDNPRVRNIADFRAIWLSDWWQPQTADKRIQDRMRDRLYRPLTMFTFAANYALHDLRPGLFMLTNVLLHALVSGLVFVFAWRLLQDEAVAWIAALLFAVHPVHSEAVANTVGRAEVLSTLFLLVGLLVLMPTAGKVGWGRLLLASLTFLAGLLAKETAICYLALAPIVLWMRTPRAERWGILWRAGIAFSLPLPIYFPMRIYALDGNLIRDMPLPPVMNPLAWGEPLYRIVAPFQILGHYARLTFAPAWLSSDYGPNVVNTGFSADLLSVSMTILGVVTAGALLWLLLGFRKPSERRRQAAWVTLLFLASYGLISNTVLLIGVPVAERVFYWPSALALLLVAMGLATAWRRLSAPDSAKNDLARLAMIVFAAVLVVLGARSYLRNEDWRTGLTLAEADVFTFPQSANLNRHYAGALLNASVMYPAGSPEHRQILETAEHHTLVSERLFSRRAETLTLRAQIRMCLGDREEAIRLFEAGLLLQQLDLPAKRMLAALRSSEESVQRELDELKAATRAAPESVAARLGYGGKLLEVGQHQQALPELKAAADLAPDNAEVQSMLGQALLGVNDMDGAKPHFVRAVQLDPDNWLALSNLGALLKDKELALACAEKAYRLKPDQLQVVVNYAEALANAGRKDAALGMFRQILQGLPADSPIRPMLEDRTRDLERLGR